ncbi:MAG TPA: GAF domain-containing protein [Anaerolineales bacterium]|nr:GAF domain-containing protein [Anaerolineales bacterium]
MSVKEHLAETQATRTTLELLYNISRELAAALDLRTVLQRVVFLAMKHVGAISGSMIVLDERGQPLEAAIFVGSRLHESVAQQLHVTIEHGLAGWVLRNQQAALILDTSKDERWLQRPDDALDKTGPKSAVCAPILAREQLVGIITLVHPTPNFFNTDHLELVQAIADQAWIAVLNARLYAESQRKARVMTALAESASAITATLKLDDVLLRILKQTIQALQVEAVALALIDPHSQELVFQAGSGVEEQSLVGARIPIGQGVAGWVAEKGQGMIVTDVHSEPHYDPLVDQIPGFEIRSIVCAPIKSHGKVLGVIEALNPYIGTFDQEALLVLAGIGSLAGTAIQHAQLYENLEAAHVRYRELFESSIDPILITNWKGEILEANRQAEEITGSNLATLFKTNVEQLGVVNEAETGPGYNRLTEGQTLSYETKLLTAGGREIPLQLYCREVSIEGASHLQWILRDITERKHLDNLRNDLISMIYHDLRSPLANVISSLDVLNTLLSKGEDQTVRTLLEIAIRSTERIQRLTDSLLDIRRLEAGQPIINRQPTPVNILSRNAIENVLPIVSGKNQEIKISMPEGLPEVLIDEDMIRRVITNLLENAVKYTPAGSKIYLGAGREKDHILMWIQDTGPGIPAGESERIFDKFTRLHGSGGAKGLGLGLAFCKLAIEAHGGHIWVEDGPETGACFKFTLPIWENQLENAGR